MSSSESKTKVLFLCTGNSCRSQMAEGLLRWLGNGRYDVYSAGVAPSRVHPMAILVMQELGVDISSQSSDLVDDYLDDGIDILISLCDYAASVCPQFPENVAHIHWPVDDPFHGWGVEEAFIPRYRETRDELRRRIEGFLQMHGHEIQVPREAD